MEIPLNETQLAGARRYRLATQAAEAQENAFYEGMLASIDTDGTVTAMDLDRGVLIVETARSEER